MCCRGATLRRHFVGNIGVAPSIHGPKMLSGFRRSIIAAILLVTNSLSARAVGEIQVYNAEIAKVGQWTMQLHLNYAFLGRKEPDFPGGLIPHRALNGTPEW